MSALISKRDFLILSSSWWVRSFYVGMLVLSDGRHHPSPLDPVAGEPRRSCAKPLKQRRRYCMWSDNWKLNYELNMTSFKWMCVSIRRIPYMGIWYTLWGIPDSAVSRIFDSTKEFHILCGVSSYYMLDHPSGFKIDKIFYAQVRLVCLYLYVTVCLYLHRRLASSQSGAF